MEENLEERANSIDWKKIATVLGLFAGAAAGAYACDRYIVDNIDVIKDLPDYGKYIIDGIAGVFAGAPVVAAVVQAAVQFPDHIF